MSTGVHSTSSSPEVADSAAPPPHVPGEAGVWVLILGDLIAFTVFFAVFLHARAGEVAAFTEGQSSLVVGFGVANTIALLTSSLAVASAMGALRAGRRPRAMRLLWAGLGCGGVFLVLKGFEYGGKFSADLTPASTEYLGWYFALTGIHLVHVLVGMVVLAVIAMSIRRHDPDVPSRVLIESGVCFWHMVDALWLVIFPVLYLLGRT